MPLSIPPFHRLPFIHSPKKARKAGKRDYWRVEPTEDYTHACCQGYKYGFLFIKFLRDYPSVVESNLLGDIVTHMDFNDQSANKGYHIGFFSYLERILYQQNKDLNFESEWLALLTELRRVQESDG